MHEGRPLTKPERQRLIASIVTRMRVGTQLELFGALAAAGCRVTQATISRDIRKLGLEKTHDPLGPAALRADRPGRSPARRSARGARGDSRAVRAQRRGGGAHRRRPGRTRRPRSPERSTGPSTRRWSGRSRGTTRFSSLRGTRATHGRSPTSSAPRSVSRLGADGYRGRVPRGRGRSHPTAVVTAVGRARRTSSEAGGGASPPTDGPPRAGRPAAGGAPRPPAARSVGHQPVGRRPRRTAARWLAGHVHDRSERLKRTTRANCTRGSCSPSNGQPTGTGGRASVASATSTRPRTRSSGGQVPAARSRRSRARHWSSRVRSAPG